VRGEIHPGVDIYMIGNADICDNFGISKTTGGPELGGRR